MSDEPAHVTEFLPCAAAIWEAYFPTMKCRPDMQVAQARIRGARHGEYHLEARRLANN